MSSKYKIGQLLTPKGSKLVKFYAVVELTKITKGKNRNNTLYQLTNVDNGMSFTIKNKNLNYWKPFEEPDDKRISRVIE